MLRCLNMKFFKNKSVLVTGGASFIGSHLVDSLLKNGAFVRVADDFSSGSFGNLEYPLEKMSNDRWTYGKLEVLRGNLKNGSFTRKVMKDVDIVFHLAASHGGRGYIQTHPVECCTNMLLDQLVFEEASKASVERICFASSACVYPTYLQDDTESSYLLKEEDADQFVRDKAFADLEYGWAKFMGEMTLRAYHKQYGTKTSSVRIFTAYGPRENETHAIIALIAKALIKMDPYNIWGSGKQKRNFTYVQDIVDALMLTSERIEDGSVVNAGRSDMVSIKETAELIFNLIGWKPQRIVYDLSKPQGVASRAANLTKAKKLLGWEPKVSYEEGIKKTIEWYTANRDLKEVAKKLDRLLMERS